MAKHNHAGGSAMFATLSLVIAAVSIILPLRSLDEYIEAREEIAVMDHMRELGFEPTLGKSMEPLRRRRSAMIAIVCSSLPGVSLFCLVLLHQAYLWNFAVRDRKYSRHS